MAQILDAAEARLDAILTAARGADGSLGSDAQARAIPLAGTPLQARYRRSANAAPLGDPAYPFDLFDRAYEWDWLTVGDLPDPANPLDGSFLEVYRCALRVGFLYGNADTQFIDALAGSAEAPSSAVLYAKRRAFGDERTITRALTFPALFQQIGDDPYLVEVVRDGVSSVQDLGGGRLLLSVPLKVILSVQTGSVYGP